MNRPEDRDLLLPGRTWIAALLLAIIGALATALLGQRYSHQSQGGRLDDAVDTRLLDHLAGHHALLQDLVDLADPSSAAVISAVLLALCLLLRQWKGALVVAIGIPIAAIMTDQVLKPFFDRTHGGGLAFPSGHTTGAFAIATSVTVVLLNAHRVHWSLRLLASVGALGIAGAIAISLVGLGYHYATDTVGGASLATTVVLLTALIVDLLPGRGRRQ